MHFYVVYVQYCAMCLIIIIIYIYIYLYYQQACKQVELFTMCWSCWAQNTEETCLEIKS